MPLSHYERERIIETQTLKAEVEATLTAGKPKSRLSDFSQQIILLVLGFALTTAVGGVLTYYWKQRDWNNQQSYLAQQRALDKKYATIDRTLKEVALTTSAAEDVLWIYYSENLSAKDVKERMDNWHKTSRDWRVQSKVLSASLAANFTDQEISKLFEQIVSKRRFLGNAVMNLPKFDPKMRMNPALQKQLQDANDLINQIVDLLEKCGSRMTAEARTYSVSNP